MAHNSYTMSIHDIYTLSPEALGVQYQANHSYPWYNYNIQCMYIFNSCNTGMSALSDMYTRRQRVDVDISGT